MRTVKHIVKVDGIKFAEKIEGYLNENNLKAGEYEIFYHPIAKEAGASGSVDAGILYTALIIHEKVSPSQ